MRVRHVLHRTRSRLTVQTSRLPAIPISVAIKAVNDHEIEETDKKAGKVVATSTSTVSADGKTMSFTFSDSSNTNGGPPVTGKGEATRVAEGPAGSNAISGSWRTTNTTVL